MNILTETAAGPRCLSQHEARLRIEQLRIQREIDQLRPAAEPELAYGEWLA